MGAAVVGHVEWVEFARVERVPAAGEIVQASEWWAEAAGGGGVASVQLARLTGACTLFTALGSDDLGDAALAQLTGLGVRVEAARHVEPQRRGFTFVDAGGERTITIIGEKHVPRGGDPLAWGELAETDGVYLVSGDAAAVQAARRARVLVATARSLPVLREAGVELDALVRSAHDPSERYEAGRPRAAAGARRRDLGPRRRELEQLRRPCGVLRGRSSGRPGRRRVRRGRQLRRGAHARARPGRRCRGALAFAAQWASAALTRRGAHGEEL